MRSSFLPAMFVALVASCVLPALAQPLAPALGARGGGGPAGGGPTGSAACADGVVPDDGSAETGYGWVPSVIEGEFVQEFDSSQFSSHRLEAVCICWLRTRSDASIDFEIVFYGEELVDGDPVPAAAPYAAVAATAEVEPKGLAESFFEVDVRGVRLPSGRSFIGARWDASIDQFFFICADQDGPAAPIAGDPVAGDPVAGDPVAGDPVAGDPVAGDPVEVFFRDDRSEGEWTSVFNNPDPIFDDHRAMMIRARSGPAVAVEVPALGLPGLAVLAAVLAVLAVAVLRRDRRVRQPMA